MAAKAKIPLDYQALLASDPVLQAANAATDAQRGQQQGALSQARQQALIGYGGVPNQATDPGLQSILGGIAPDITDTTRQLAQQSTDSGLSTLAQLQHGYEQKQGADIASLAGRNMLHSGAYRQHSMENLQGLQQSTANAQTSLLDKLSGLWSGYQAEQAGNTAAKQGATSSALDRIYGQINAGTLSGAAPTPAAAAPASSSFAPGSNSAQVARNTTGYGAAARPSPVIARRTQAAPGRQLS